MTPSCPFRVKRVRVAPSMYVEAQTRGSMKPETISPPSARSKRTERTGDGALASFNPRRASLASSCYLLELFDPPRASPVRVQPHLSPTVSPRNTPGREEATSAMREVQDAPSREGESRDVEPLTLLFLLLLPLENQVYAGCRGRCAGVLCCCCSLWRDEREVS